MAFGKPRLPLGGQLTIPRSYQPVSYNSKTCFFCSLIAHRPSSSPKHRRHPRAGLPSRRYQSTASTTRNPRQELEETLKELWRQAPHVARSSRLTLALEGLRQTAGEERVRVAIIGLDAGNAKGTAQDVLRLLLADPLGSEQQWETDLEARDGHAPFIVRVSSEAAEVPAITLETERSSELDVSSPVYNRMNLEFICLSKTLEPPTLPLHQNLLEPIVDESTQPPTSFPVHKALIVTDGFKGAVVAAQFPNNEFVRPAVNLEGVPPLQSDSPFVIIDTNLGSRGLARFREGTQHAIEYEKLWSGSNLSELSQWLKSGIQPTYDGTTKPFLRDFIASWLQDIRAKVDGEEVPVVDRSKLSLAAQRLSSELAAWSETAHRELQTELERAFNGRRWRKLGWWKLFWRVDDVGLLTSELLAQRFLPSAERELVYFTGRMAELPTPQIPYRQPTSSVLSSEDTALTAVIPTPPKWPTHISFTRKYLQNETIPALQALAQRLVAQSIGTTGIATSLAALLYVSSMVSSVYEAAAVASLGVIYSLGRMQKKWENARGFWEGEVKEEGRKAVKAAEESVLDVLAERSSGNNPKNENIEKIKDLLDKADDALQRMK